MTNTCKEGDPLSRILVIILLLLAIIGSVIYVVSPKESFEYENALPQQPTAHLLDFFRSKLFYDKHLISKEYDEGYIYQEESIHDSQLFISYALSPPERVRAYYFDRLKSEEENKYAYRKVNPTSYLEKIHDPIEYGLPSIHLTNDVLTIQTTAGELTFSTISFTDVDDVDVSNVYYVSVVGVNEHSFYLKLGEDNHGEFDDYLLFVKQDLTDYQFIKGNEETFEQFMKTDEFSLYADLFPPNDGDARYVTLDIFQQYQQQVLDVKNKTFVEIEEGDYLSEDGKYVYLSGNQPDSNNGLPEGAQYIQTFEDYMAGNDSYVTTFDLDFKAIQKAAEFGGIGTRVSDAYRYVVYFNEELLIIHLTYDAAIVGIAGETNVVVDFHEDKENPHIYILDLSAS